MYLTLYRKYRPGTFEEVYGGKEIIKTIRNSLKENRLAHAYLFTGPRGVGKTTTARLIAKGLNCLTNGITDNPCNICENCVDINKGNFFDLIEIDAASNRGIDEIRELKDKINYKPVKGRKKVYIIDEVHMLTKEAFNALLKTLEEPPSHAIFILATTEPDKILDTIISRCQRYDFSTISLDEVQKRLRTICNSEGIKIDDASLKMVYDKSGGSLRDAISILEKVISFYLEEDIDIEKTEKALGIIPQAMFEAFDELVMDNSLEESLKYLDALWNDGINVEDFFKDYAFFKKSKLLNAPEKENIIVVLDIIDNIFDAINKFKYEEDKRLIGYVILNRIIAKNIQSLAQTVQVMPKQLASSDQNTEALGDESLAEPVKEFNVSIDVKQIKKEWNKIVDIAKEKKISLLAILNKTEPLKIEKNKLIIGFPFENKFHKNTMEKKENRNIISNVIKSLYDVEMDIGFEVIGGKESGEGESSFVNELVDFFDGEIIESR